MPAPSKRVLAGAMTARFGKVPYALAAAAQAICCLRPRLPQRLLAGLWIGLMRQRGLSHAMPFMASINASPLLLPPVSVPVNEMHSIVAAKRNKVRAEAIALLE